MERKRLMLLAKGYAFLIRNRIAWMIINRILDIFAWLDIRILALLSMWHPDMNYRLKYLRKRGVSIGENVHIDYGVYIEFTTPKAVVIEDYVGIGYGANIISHDAGLNAIVDMPMRVTPVRLCYGTKIGSYVTILPGVTMGRFSAALAGSVVTKDVPEGTVVAGNPAKPIGKVEDFIQGWQADLKVHTEFYYDHPNENRPPSTPYDHLVTWRKEGIKIQPHTKLRTGTPFDYILDAKEHGSRE